MKKLTVDVQPDFIHQLASVSGRPLTGVLELIWNAFDADATEVSVSFDENALSGLTRIRVTDNGIGIDPTHVETYFGRLGGSWKLSAGRSAAKRVLHGSQGKGRFKAFGLGSRVEWRTSFGDQTCYSIIGRSDDIKNFQISEPAVAHGSRNGTEVTIDNLASSFPSLRGDTAVQHIAEATAVYLEQYPGIILHYDGRVVDPTAVQVHRAELEIGPFETDNGPQSAKLVVIEWRNAASRRLYLCDDEGCTLHEMPPGIQAPGYNFTAYLKASHVRELEQKNQLSVAELHPDLTKLLDATKKALKEHFTRRDAEKALQTIKRWQEEDVYPYAGVPAGRDPAEPPPEWRSPRAQMC